MKDCRNRAYDVGLPRIEALATVRLVTSGDEVKVFVEHDCSGKINEVLIPAIPYRISFGLEILVLSAVRLLAVDDGE